MLFQFLTTHAFTLIFWGFIVSSIGSAWMLFAAYAIDPGFARRWLFLVVFPPALLAVVVQDPRRTIIPFTLSIAGSLAFLLGLIGFLSRFAPHARP